MEVVKHVIENFCRQKYQINKHHCLIFGIAIFLFGLCSHTSAQTPVQADLRSDNSNYRIGAGDILKILILKQDVLSQDGIRVSNEGTVRMPMLEDPIPAACLTETQLSSEITTRYKKFLLNPQVYVSVKEYRAYPVAVIGAVNAPKSFQLERPMRLFQILSQVNGPAANAGQTVQIFRDPNAKTCEQNVTVKPENAVVDESSGQEIISLSLSGLLNGDDTANPYIQGGDVIRITEADLKQAFVIGNVKSAATINLKEPITLSRAIAMAGGFAPGAQMDKIKISRQSSEKPIFVNLKDNKGGTQEDILLQPNDIVDVPGPKRSFLKDMVKGLIPGMMRFPMLPY